MRFEFLPSIPATILVGVVITLLAPTTVVASDKSVALIVDAYGGMRAKLASGQARIEATKDAAGKLKTGVLA